MSTVATVEPRTYEESITGARQNPFSQVIRRAFNAIAHGRIQDGDKRVHVMMLDERIVVMQVTDKQNGYAILVDPNGESYGVSF